MQSDAPPTRAAVPSPALFSCTAAAVSRRAARPRPLVSRTPLCVARDYYPPRRRRLFSSFSRLCSLEFRYFLSRARSFEYKFKFKNAERKNGISLFFCTQNSPLLSSSKRRRRGAKKRKRKREKGGAPCFFFFFSLVSLFVCVCAVSRVVLSLLMRSLKRT